MVFVCVILAVVVFFYFCYKRAKAKKHESILIDMEQQRVSKEIMRVSKEFQRMSTDIPITFFTKSGQKIEISL